MNPADLDTLLRQTLVDRKLSGGEKTALTAWIGESIRTEQERHVARSRAVEAAKLTVADPNAQSVIDWLADVLKLFHLPAPAGPSVASEAYFSPGDACLGQIVHRFASARRSADVCVFTVTDDRIARAILDAHRRGVAVRLITDNDKAFDLGSDVERLGVAGVAVRVDRTPFHMHHKYAIFDGTRLLNGSYNWTRGAAEQNEENLIDTGDPRLLAAFQRHFETLWDVLV